MSRLPLPEPDTRLPMDAPPRYRADQLHTYADASNAALRERVKALEQLVIDAAYTMEGARIWGGMDWTYNPLHPFKYLPMLQRLNVERGKIGDARASLEVAP